MKVTDSKMKQVKKISSISPHAPDDLFITCASFEERCLGTLQKFDNYLTSRVVLFKFTEPNPAREENVFKMEKIIKEFGFKDIYERISVRHGITPEGILKFHKYCKSHNLLSKAHNLSITIDITTFTKELLCNLLFYLTEYIKFQRLRLLYTIPEKYAAADEGPLSHGIKKIRVMPFFWNSWSATKDDVLIVILGYEEMRAWSLISQFDANINILFVTKPGSKPEWDMHCEGYNHRLLKGNFKIANMPAMAPFITTKLLEDQIIKSQLYKKYNIFIAPLGTKPQVVGTFCFINKYPESRVNIVSTTAIEHNTPYYSSGIGETFYTYLELS